MCTTFVLYVLTNYASVKRYSRSNVEKCQKWREFFASIFSGPGELLGKSPPGKSNPLHAFIMEHSILCKKFKTLALKVTEEIRGQEEPLKSHYNNNSKVFRWKQKTLIKKKKKHLNNKKVFRRRRKTLLRRSSAGDGRP